MISIQKNDQTYEITNGFITIQCKDKTLLSKLVDYLESYSTVTKTKTRREMIMSALEAGEPLTIQQIIEKSGVSQDEQRNFASTCLNLVEKKKLKRKKNSHGLFAYFIP